MLGYGFLNHIPAAPLVGRTVAQYFIVDKIGGGGMGVVYLARDTKLERAVALKFLPPQWSQDEGAKQRFLREAQAASATNHRNICIIHDIEETDDGQLFIVMAYYEGQTLKQRLEQGALPAAEAIDVAAEIAEGLAKAHAQRVVHRDIKPGNIMLTEDGVKILDFGLAKLADAALKLTLEGSTLGTIAYMSPEQARGDEADERSDVWSLGVVLYEMLAGEPPFRGGYPEAIAYAIKNEPPPPLSGKPEDIPDSVERIVQRALRKDPEARYQAARDMARELRYLQGRSLPMDLRTEPVRVEGREQRAESEEQGTRSKGQRTRMGRRRVVGAAAGAAALVVALAGGYAWMARPLPRTHVVVVPVANHTGDPDLDQYRPALTQTLIGELSDSPNLRMTPYPRVLEALWRFGREGDMSSQQAIQSLVSQSGASLVIVPVLEERDGAWVMRADLRNAATATSTASVETVSPRSSLRNETVQQLTRSLAISIQDRFPVRWPHRISPRPAGSRFRSLDAARAFEEAINAYEQMEYAVAQAGLKRSVAQDPRALTYAWLSRTALVMGDTRAAEAAGQTAAKNLARDAPVADAHFVAATLADARSDRRTAEDRYREIARLRADDTAARLDLADFLKRQSRNAPAVEVYHEVLRLDPRIVRVHVDLCQLYAALDNYTLAETHARTALEQFRALGHRGGEGQASLCYADLLLQQGVRLDEARTHLTAAQQLFTSLNHAYSLSRLYQYLGYLAARQRDYPAAIEAFGEALVRSRQVGNRTLEGLELMNLGLAHARMGEIAKAVTYFQESRDVYQEIGDERGSAEQEVLAAGLQVDYGSSVTDALKRVAKARLLLRELGQADFEVVSMQVEATAARQAGRPEESLRVLRQASTIATERNLNDRMQSLKTDIGISHFVSGDLDSAKSVLEAPAAAGFPEAQLVLARVYVAQRDLAAAKSQIEAASTSIQAAGELMLLPLQHLVSGELAHASGASEEARLQFAKAAESWTAEFANAAAVEGRCMLGVLEKRPALIESAIGYSEKAGRALLADRCRNLSRQLASRR